MELEPEVRLIIWEFALPESEADVGFPYSQHEMQEHADWQAAYFSGDLAAEQRRFPANQPAEQEHRIWVPERVAYPAIMQVCRESRNFVFHTPLSGLVWRDPRVDFPWVDQFRLRGVEYIPVRAYDSTRDFLMMEHLRYIQWRVDPVTNTAIDARPNLQWLLTDLERLLLTPIYCRILKHVSDPVDLVEERNPFLRDVPRIERLLVKCPKLKSISVTCCRPPRGLAAFKYQWNATKDKYDLLKFVSSPRIKWRNTAEPSNFAPPRSDEEEQGQRHPDDAMPQLRNTLLLKGFNRQMYQEPFLNMSKISEEEARRTWKVRQPTLYEYPVTRLEDGVVLVRIPIWDEIHYNLRM